MKKKLIKPGLIEDQEITKAAKSDPDTFLLSDKQWRVIQNKLLRSKKAPLSK